MPTSNGVPLGSIRKIDNSRVFLPIATSILIILLIVMAVWFFRGGSFKLYASVFFGLYYLTNQVWLSVLLIGIFQNIVFLPLRFVGLRLSTSLEDFENKLTEIKSDNDQYILFQKKVKEGDVAVVFYIFNFVANAIAFLSAGRIFLIDFYSQALDPNLLYSFIPYPNYPLQGTDFYFPFFKITETISLSWGNIFMIWLGISLLFALVKFLWRFLKYFFSKNQAILQARIGYNRLLIQTAGFSGTIFILSLIFFRHIPVSFESWWLVADLTRQNSTMNLITAIGTFITAYHAGYVRALLASSNAGNAGIPKDVIASVFKDNMRVSFRNGLILGAGAYLVTSQIPSAFELSVATFEILYILSPLTFDLLLNKASKINTPQPQT